MIFHIQQEKFEGPLELLLEFIEQEKLAISEISLARVAEEYIAYVRSQEQPDPEALAEFLVIAAQLMFIKSRSLLPSLIFSEEEEASMEELEHRLREYQFIRARADVIKKIESRRRPVFTREAYLLMKPFFFPPPHLTPEIIRDSLKSFLAALPKIEKLAEEKIRRVLSLEERMRHISAFVERAFERAFSELTQGSREKIEIIVSFLAILELAKQKIVELNQTSAFGEIIVKRL